VAPDGYNAALDLSHTALRAESEGERYTGVLSSDPRFRSVSVKAEVKGSYARVAQTPLVPEHLGRSPTYASGGPLLRLLVPGVLGHHPLQCETHSTASATSRDLSPALQDELVALCALSVVLVRRRSVDPPYLVSWRSAPPPAPVAHEGPLPPSVRNAGAPFC